MNNTFPICYETFGDQTNPCIILVMGIGGQLIDWPKVLIQGLVDEGFYVVTFDNRDSGLSRQYDELGAPDINEVINQLRQGKPCEIPYTLGEMADDVILLMDHLHIEKAHITGISMGGIIAQYVAINFPSRVETLTCIASTSGETNLPPAKKEVMEFFTNSSRFKDKSVESQINNKLQLFKLYNHPKYFDEVKLKDQLTNAFNRSSNSDGFKRLMLAMILASPRTELLKKLTIPVLIIHGDIDPVFSIEHGKQLASCIPNSRLEIIQNMGHGLPDYFAEIIVKVIVEQIKMDKSPCLKLL